jgi:SAM-dependent methyltransferase
VNSPGCNDGVWHDPSGPLPVEVKDLWEVNANWWQERFTDGADPEYVEQIIPMLAEALAGASPARVLDIGCGEGQLSRVAAGVEGVRAVVGLDPTWAQLEEARRRSRTGGPHYVRCAAASLPFPCCSFDFAFACLVFEHIEDAELAIGEVGRVLRAGGTFVLMLNHPLLQAPGSGWVDDHILGEQYWRIGPYLAEHHAVEEVDKGVWLPFVHRPLSVYVNALAASGLYLTGMAEPAPPPAFLERAEEYRQAAAFPRLLVLRAEKLTRRP